jgi:hypothetical protein
MNITKVKFVVIFLIFAFVFQFVTNSIFGSGVGGFPNSGESFLGTEPQTRWGSAGYKILLPIKIVLIGPMLTSDEFLRDDPPPPLVVVVFALYWTFLAIALHCLIGRIKYS